MAHMKALNSRAIATTTWQQESFKTELGRLQIPQGIFPRPAQVADGFIVDGGNINRGEVP
jgi:hypothetical protein